MFHIKVSYTSSFSAAFRSPTPPFTRSYIRLHSSADRVENRDLLLLFWLGFFLLYVSRLRRRISGRKSAVDGEKWKCLVIVLWKKISTVTDRNSFFCTKTRKNLSQLKKISFVIFFSVFLQVKIVLCVFFFRESQPSVCDCCESILSVKIYYKRRKRKSRRCHENTTNVVDASHSSANKTHFVRLGDKKREREGKFECIHWFMMRCLMHK